MFRLNRESRAPLCSDCRKWGTKSWSAANIRRKWAADKRFCTIPRPESTMRPPIPEATARRRRSRSCHSPKGANRRQKRAKNVKKRAKLRQKHVKNAQKIANSGGENGVKRKGSLLSPQQPCKTWEHCGMIAVAPPGGEPG